MKKRSLKSLKLKKELVSNLNVKNTNNIKGGGPLTVVNTDCCIDDRTNALNTRCCGVTNATFCCTFTQ